ncbi:MAG: hypothetical protein OXQ29_14335 [Rhodospirillaceae bacterium]|nr:hypothetical protein [Rhodospirillaceae bacterium]
MTDLSGEGPSEPRKPELVVGLNAVILAVTAHQPRVLTVSVQELGEDFFGMDTLHLPRALPFGSFDEKNDRTLELCMRRSVLEKTRGELGYVEQLYTFADQGRDPTERAGGNRVLSVGYLALAREQDLSQAENSSWQHCYRYFPWEDWRGGRPRIMDDIESALLDWSNDRAERRERVEICFGLGNAGWDAYQVLERYELLYEARLISEYWTDRGRDDDMPSDGGLGESMAFDHRRILATGLGRIRGKLRYRPVAFELLPPTFTLLELQRVVEALTGLRVHKQNFRRQVERAGLVEGTGRRAGKTGGRPAELFRFRRAVLRERRAPGMATLQGARRSGN